MLGKALPCPEAATQTRVPELGKLLWQRLGPAARPRTATPAQGLLGLARRHLGRLHLPTPRMQLPYSCSSRLHIVLFYSKLVFSLLLLRLSWGLLQGVPRPHETVQLDEGTGTRAGAVGGVSERESGPLILLWNRYQETGSRVYSTIFARYRRPN